MLIVHGDYDQTVPVEHSRRFVEGLKKAGADYQYIEIEDMGHSPQFFEQNMQWFPESLTSSTPSAVSDRREFANSGSQARSGKRPSYMFYSMRLTR